MTPGTGTGPALADAPLIVHAAVVRHGTAVLADVRDLRLEPGRPVTVVGESGSGKSVLAHALMGTLPPELAVTGRMTLGRTALDLADRSGRRDLWGSGLALLPQEPALALDPTARVRGQVAEGAPRGQRRAQALRLADRRLDELGLVGVGDAYPHELSGGMAQRVAYAAATLGGAHVLVVDEPSKGLDRDAVDRLADLLLAHVGRGGLLLAITHDLRLARRLGGDVLVMRRAEVVESGPAESVLGEPAHAYTRELLAAEPSRWSYPWMRSAGAVDLSVEPVVVARDVTKAYGPKVLFRDLCLEVRPGERWALTGPSGVGKTTLGNALLGLAPVDAGAVTRGSAYDRGRVQKLYQDPALSFPARVPLEAVLHDVLQRHRADPALLRSLLERVGLHADLLRRRPDQVSGGELQRMAIVRATLTRPVLVLADEATSRLDLITQASTVDVLLREVAEQGCALLLVTHDRELAGAVADHHLVLEP